MEQRSPPNGTETCPWGCPLLHTGLTISVGQTPECPPSTGSPGSHLLSAWPHPLPDSSRQPPNILMVHPAREDIKICDFGFAQKITPAEPQYSKYGCPEFVSPEIIQQTPVSKASDIW